MMDTSHLTNHLFLWHLTPRQKADRIASAGFVPKGMSRQDHPSRAIWFFHSAFSFVHGVGLQKRPEDCDGFWIALPIDSLEPWNGQAPDEFTAFQPIAPEHILCRFPATGAQVRDRLRSTLQAHLGDNLIDELATLGLREDLPWSQRTSPASALMYLDRDRYETEQITALAIEDGLEGCPRSQAEALHNTMAQIDFRFYHHFLRNYYFTYGERHLVRAFLTAAARRIGVDRVAQICIEQSDPGHHPVARFVADLLPNVRPADLILALFELRVVRTDTPSTEIAALIESWLTEQSESEEAAKFLVAHGHDIFHARFGDEAVGLAARILAGRPGALVDLRAIGDSSFPQSRIGAVQALGVLGDPDAIPYLASCLDTDWKRMREATIRSLGKIGGDTAKTFVSACQDDRAGSVKRVAQKTLASMN